MRNVAVVSIAVLGLLAAGRGLAAEGQASPPGGHQAGAALQWKFEHDASGLLSATVDPGGKRTELRYDRDRDGRLQKLTRKLADGSSVTLELDRFGRRTRMEDALGAVRYDYDGFGHLTAVRREGSLPVLYANDTLDRLASLRVGGEYTVTYAYDFLGRLAQMGTPAGDVSYEYQSGPRRVIRTLPNGIRTVWEYGPDGHLRTLAHIARDNRILAQFQYRYRPDGLLGETKEWSPRGEKVLGYDYDTVGRLTAVGDSVQGKTEYRYDRLGNRTELRAPGKPAVTAAYDWAGRLVSHDGELCSHDGAGNLTGCAGSGGQRAFEYDAANRLARVTAGKDRVSYQYDGDGLLVARRAGEEVTTFVPDPSAKSWRPLAAIGSKGRTVMYVWDGAVPLTEIAQGEAATFFLHDHLGSVRYLTDIKGNITESIAYTPYGSAWGDAAGMDLQLGFGGLLFDPTASVYLTRARAFDPRLGRFLQPDPVSRVPSSSQKVLSTYLYSGSDPVNYVDVTGEAPRFVWGPQNWAWQVLNHPLQLLDYAYSRRFYGQQAGRALASAGETGLAVAAIQATFFDLVGGYIPGEPETEGQGYAGVLWSILPGPAAAFGIARTFASSLVNSYEGYYREAILDIVGLAGAHLGQEAQRLRETPILQGDQYFFSFVSPEITARADRFQAASDWIDVFGRWRDVKTTWDVGFANNTRHGAGGEVEYRPQNLPISFQPPAEIPGRVRAVTRELDRYEAISRELDRWEKIGAALEEANRPKGGPPPSGCGSGYEDLACPGAAARRRPGFPGGGDGGPPPGGGGASPLAPTNVGGIYLRGAGEALKHLGRLTGVAVEPTRGSLVLLSEKAGAVRLPPLRLDDIVTIFRSVYEQGDAPFVSIDPKPEDPEGPTMIVRHGPGTGDTYVGWVLFEADRVMKTYSLGRDNVTRQPVRSGVQGYQSLLDLGFSNLSGGHADPVWERFWIVPAEVSRRQAADRRLTLLHVPLKVRTQRMVWDQGKLVPAPDPTPSREADAFARWFTEHYDDIAREARMPPPAQSAIEVPVAVYSELQRIALVTAIAESLRDQGVPLPAWMRDYQGKPVAVSATTPSLVVEASRTETRGMVQGGSIGTVETTQRRRIFGGVSLAAEDAAVHTVPGAPEAQTLAPVLSREVAKAPLFAPVSLERDGKRYEAVTLPGDDTRDVGACRLAATDLVVPLRRGGQIALVRRFHSFFRPADILGGAWTLDLPRLDAQRRPVRRSGEVTEYRTVYQLATPLGTWSEGFSEARRVPEVDATLLVPDGPSDMLGLATMDDARIGRSTQVLLFRDGRRWYFDDAGALVAREQTPLMVIYRRDAAHRVRGIEGWHGGKREAEIGLEYDEAGRLAAARGSNGDVVSYRYDKAGWLTKVDRPRGAVEYGYQDGLVTTVAGSGRTLQEFAYNTRGQLQSERRADGATVTYTRAAGPRGLQATATLAGTRRAAESVEYDAQFRPTRRLLADGTRMEWRRPKEGGVESTLNLPSGERYLLTQSSDGTGRSLQVPEGGTYTARYDAAGRLTALSRDGRESSRQDWLTDGRLASATYETLALHLEYREDGVLNGLLVTPPEAGPRFSRWRHVAYDDLGRPASVTDYSGADIKIGYDKTGQAATLASNGGRVEMARDGQGRVSSVQTSWGYRQDNTYGPAGGDLARVELSQGGDRAVLELERGRPTRARQFDGGKIEVAYYDDGTHPGRLKEIQTPNGVTVSYEYDAHDRLGVVDVSGAYRVEYAYDTLGRLTGMVQRPALK